MAWQISGKLQVTTQRKLWGRLVVLSALLASGALPACGGQAFTSGDGDSGDGDSGDGDLGDGDLGDGDSGDGDLGDGDTGGDSGDGDLGEVDRSCSDNSGCTLVSATCCGSCGVPGVGDMTAVSVGQTDAHFRDVCGVEPAICPACAAALNPNLFAQCVDGTCEAQDLTTHVDSECSDSDKCVLIPDACCPCGAGNTAGEVVAINSSRTEAFRASQCAEEGMGEPVACNECEWVPPSDLFAECADSRCTVTDGL